MSELVSIPGRLEIALTVIAVAAASFVLFIQENDFPHYYHADEPSKTRQIVEGERNFRHPLLMLTVTEAAMRVFDVPRNDHAAVVAGRCVSAGFTAVAVAAMTLLAFWKGGRLAGWATAFFLVTHWDIFEKAHYLKEDPALLVGLALTFLAMGWLRRAPSRGGALLLGLATGTALSAKYIGVVALPLALPAVWIFGRPRASEAALRTVILLAGLVAAGAVFNYPIFTAEGWETFRASLANETDKAVHGTWSERTELFSFGFFERILYVARAHMIPFMAFWIFVLWRDRKRGRFCYDDYLAAAFPFLLAAVLAFSMKTSGRYFLPGALLIGYTAGLGLAEAVVAISRARRGLFARRGVRAGVAALCVGLAVIGSIERLVRYYGGLQRDPRARLSAYVRDALPPEAKIVQGYGVHIANPVDPFYAHVPDRYRVSQKVVTARQPPDLGTLQELFAAGVTHVAVTGHNYERYTKSGESPKDDDRFAKRRKFYRDLFNRHDLLWKSEADRVGTHNPPLRLYRLKPAELSGTRGADPP